MQTEKSQSDGKRIMPVYRVSGISVDPRVGISRSASDINDLLFFLPVVGKIVIFKTTFLFFLVTL